MRFFSTLLASLIGTLVGLGLVFFFGLMFLVALASTAEQAPSIRPGTVLVAELSGAYPDMVSGDPLAQALGGEPSLSLHDAVAAFRMAAVDDRIDGVWLKLGVLSTDWPALQALHRALADVSAAGKTVYASSASYYMGEDELYLAAAADSIFLDPESRFEFNGFALQMTFFSRLFERAGVNPQTVRAGRFKSAVEPYTRESLSDENRLQLAGLVEDISDHFLETIAAARGLDVRTATELARDGSLMTARDALEVGLVDALAYEDQVRDLFGDDPRTVSLKRYARSSPAAAGIGTGRDGEIAVIYASGEIVPGNSGGLPGAGGPAGARGFVDAMRSARNDADVDAIVVRVNSPGGVAPAADAMLREVRLAAGSKPIYVSMGGMAASGGYWIAAPADTIVAEALTLTGSIGVFGLMLDFSELLEDRIGITFDGVQSGPAADMNSGVRSLRSSERLALEASVDQTYKEFLEIVAEGRDMTVEEVDRIAQGRVWTGTDALEVGLVDVLGGLEETVRIAAARVGLEEGTYRVTHLPRPPSFLDVLTESMEARIAARLEPMAQADIPPAVAAIMSDVAALYRLTQGVQARLPYFLEIR